MKKNKIWKTIGVIWKKTGLGFSAIALGMVVLHREEYVRPFINVALAYHACDALIHIVSWLLERLQKK
uniref:hypothetical protein n=1 Tax=Acetatifactor sp. TaxID=1872090 RepID=UPI004056D256